MPKEVIAIDLDDVLADSAAGFAKYSNERWGTKLTADDYHENWTKVWGIEKEEAEKRAVEFHESDAVAGYVHKPEAIPVLKDLAERYDLVVVTSRRKVLDRVTREWLEKHFEGVFRDVILAGFYDRDDVRRMAGTKAQSIGQIGAKFLIDDQIKHCLAASEAGVKVVLFGDYSWNQSDRLPDGVTRCRKWQQVSEYFESQK